jgi:cytidyltransferase-like protein
MTITVLASGGFDPLHIGHLKYLQAARDLGTKLVVCLNSDAWLQRKKGYVFMRSAERKAILAALRCVDVVWVQEWSGDDMASAIRYWRPHIFAKGGDRRSIEDLPIDEVRACTDLGVRIKFGVGGYDKPESSSDLVRRAAGAVQ